MSAARFRVTLHQGVIAGVQKQDAQGVAFFIQFADDAGKNVQITGAAHINRNGKPLQPLFGRAFDKFGQKSGWMILQALYAAGYLYICRTLAIT
jgi:predicted transcriptional regulator